MDTERIAGLTAEIKGQMWLMEKVSDSPWERLRQRLQSRVNDGLDTPGQLDSVAYQTHNLYCSAEDLLKLIASSFENKTSAGGDWHLIGHAYGTEIELTQLQANLSAAQQLYGVVPQ